MSLDQGQDLILASLYATIITLKTISSQCIYRLPVHSLLLLGPPRSTQDQPLMIQKAHANKLFFLEEDSLTSLRKGFTMEFLLPLSNLWPIGCLRIKEMLSIIS